MASHATTSASTARPTVRELPPSAKLVVKTLEYEGSLTQAELVESTRLPGRTVRYALRKLEAEDLITARISFADARQRIYSLATDDP